MAAEDCLFYDNDFKVLIDLLIRVMGSCPDGISVLIFRQKSQSPFIMLSSINRKQKNAPYTNKIK